MTTAAIILAACAWAHPGEDTYTGSADDAVMRIVPPEDQPAMLGKVRARAFNGRVRITRDAITDERGALSFAPTMTRMHSGFDKVCGQGAVVDRSAWPADHVEWAWYYRVLSRCRRAAGLGENAGV